MQVKNYTGEIGSDVTEQLRTAYERYSKEGKVLSLVVMTTAEKMSSDLAEAASELSKELAVPVEMVLRKKMIKILADGLIRKVTAVKESVGT